MNLKIYFLALLFFLLSCGGTSNIVITGDGKKGGGNLSPTILSLSDTRLTTCIFNLASRIAHFPTYHKDPLPQNGNLQPGEEAFEKIVKSQFQLLHTIYAYLESNFTVFVFDENATEKYNQGSRINIYSTENFNRFLSTYIINPIDNTQELGEVKVNRAQILFEKEFLNTMKT